MRKFLLSVLFIFSLSAISFKAAAQCPTVGGTTINTCDFGAGGEITIIFTDGNATNQEGYILYDVSGGTPTAVSDPFGPVSKTYIAGSQTLIFGGIPDGTYLAARSGCPTLGGFGINIDQTNELILSVNSITSDCDNLGSGEIDIQTTGGDAPFSYAWTPALPDQEDQTGLSAGSYDVTVTDADNCTFTLTGIIIPAGPAAQNITNADPTNVCSGDDLTVSLDNSEVGVTYEVLVNGAGSGTTAAGIGSNIDITLASGAFADGDIISVEGDDGACPPIAMTGSFTVNVTTITVQNVTNVDPTAVCPGDDLTVSLGGSEVGVTYEVLVGGVGSGTTAAGTGANLDITLASGSFADGDVISVEGSANGCVVAMNGSFTVDVETIAVQNVTNVDPTAVCSGDDLTVSLDGSEAGVTYEVLVNGAGSGTTAAGTGANLDITLASGDFADGDVITVEADNGSCPVVLMNGSFTVNIITIAAQNVTNADPTNVCSGDDLTVSLAGSEVGVTYEVLVNGAGSGTTAAGTGSNIDITLASGDFADGDVITVEGTLGSCATTMTGSFTVNVTTITAQNVTNADPTNVCSGDDLTVSLDNSEVGVTYEVLVGGVGSGTTAAGTGSNLDITLASGDFADGDVITVEGSASGCTVLMTGSFTVNIVSISAQNITNADPTNVCSGDDLTVSLDNSEVGVTYEVLVNGAGSGTTAAGIGSNIDITLASGAFADGDIISVEGDDGACPPIAMTGSFTVNVTTITVQNVTNVDPTAVCPGDDLTVSLGGSEVGVTYEVLVGGVGSGTTAAGTGANLDITLASGSFADGDVISVEGSANGCVVAMNGSFTVDVETIAVQNVTNVDPTAVCSGDDLTVSLDGSEAGVTYEVLVNGAGSGTTAAGTGANLDITLASGDFADGDVITVEADNGSCPVVLMNGSFTVNIITIAAQNVTNADPTNVCSGDDLTVSLAGSEVGVTYEVLVNGAGSGTTAAGTGSNIDITLASGDFADGDVITVEGTLGSCATTMTGSFTVNVTTITAQNVTNADPTNVCSGDDLTVSLDNSEVGVTYEVLVGGVGSGTTAAGTGSNLDITLASGDFADGDVITVEGSASGCTVLMTGSFTVNIVSISAQNITNADPTNVCSGDDLTVSLDNSEAGVTYEVLVNGAGSGTTAAGTGSNLDITLASGDFSDGDVITVEGSASSCTLLMTGSFTVNVTTIAVQNVTNADPTAVCPGDDLTVSLGGSEVGVTYEVLVGGVGSGTTAAGTGANLDITLASGSFADGDVISVEGSANGCVVAMNGSFTVDVETIAVQNVTNVDPTAVCSGDDLTVSLDGSEAGVTYEVLVNGAGSGTTAAGTGSNLDITLASGDFADGDVITVEADNGSCPVVLMNGSFTVNIITIAAQNVTNADPTNVCSGDDLTVSLAGSEVGVTYEVLVNGAGSGTTAAGTGSNIDITLASGDFADGDVITVEGTLGSCATTMTGSFTVNVTTITAQNVTNADPTNVCSGDDLTVSLDNSEVGVTYEVLVGGVGSGTTAAGTGSNLDITLASGDFADGDVITVEGSASGCTVLMTGSFTVNIVSISAQNITNADPTNVCSGDDLTVSLDNSEAGVTYEVLVNGAGSGTTAAGTGSNLDITLASGDFADGDVITVEGSASSCTLLMTGSFTVNVTTIAVQNVTNADPTAVCPGDDLTVSLGGSEVGVTYEILVGGVGSGTTAAGTGANLDITLASGSFADGDVISVEGSANGCVVAMNGSFTVDVETIAVQNVTNVDPTAVCSGDDLTVSLDGSEAGVTYEVLVNGAGSGTTAAGTGANLDITLASGDFADGDVITVEADNGSCPVVLMNGSFTVNIITIAAQNVTNADPTNVCSGDDLTVSLAGSEVGVTYEVLVNGAGSGTTAAGTGSNIDITLASGDFADGDVITVEGTLGSCATTMTGSFTVNVTTITAQNVTNADPTNVCSGDDLTVSLDNSEVGVTYEVLVGGVGSGTTAAGTGSNLDITLASGDFADGDVITVEGSASGCTVLMTGSFTVNIVSISAQNITNADPTNVCSGDDLTVSLDNSEAGVTYEVLVNGAGSGTTAAGTGSNLDITLASGDFSDGDVITVEGSASSCTLLMTGSFTVNVTTIAVQNVTNADPTAVCPGDDLTVSLGGSEVGVTYEVLVGGVGSGTTAAGTGANLDITLASGDFADGDVISVEGSANGCVVAMNGSFTVDVETIAVQNVTNVDPTAVCSGDDLTVSLDGSEAGVTYEVLVNGAGSGTTAAGTGANLDITLASGDFADGDVITVEADNGSCPVVLMNGSFTVNIITIAAQNVTNADPTNVCSGDDLTVSLAGSEVGVTYEVLVNGAGSGTTAAGTGSNIDITLASGDFADGDVITVEGTLGSCATTMTGSFTVQSITLSVSGTPTNTTGCGVADGSIDITPTSSFPGDTFTFSWVGPNSFTASTEDITGLEGGTYDVTVTSDNTGCVATSSFTIVDPVPFTLDNFVVINQTQCGVSNGSVSFDVVGGTGPFNYYIVDTNSSTEVASSRSDADASSSYAFSSLAPGDYEVFVEDGPCTNGTTFTIAAVNEITAFISDTNSPNCGATDGSIELTISDVGNDYDVTIDDGINPPSTTTETAGTATVDLTGLGQGSYIITITDNTTNCIVTLNRTLNENAAFTIDNISSTNIQTCGGNEGEIDVTLGGTLSGSQTFVWSGPVGFVDPGTEDLTGLTIAGDYFVTIQDAGCTVVSNTLTITEPASPTADAGTDETICINSSQLNADVAPSDVTGTWSVVSVPATANIANVTFDDINLETATVSGLNEIGNYTLAWTLENDTSACQDVDEVIITRKDITVADAGTDLEVCEGVATLSANAAGTNETGTWTIISEPAGISSSATFDDVNIEGTNFNIADLTVSGDYVIRWTITDDNSICNETFEEITITYELPPDAGEYVGTVGTATLANNPFDLFTLLDGTQDAGGTWSLVDADNGGGTNPILDTNTGSVDFTSASDGLYEYDYIISGSIPCAADTATVLVEFLNFECEDTKFTTLTEEATCQGVQDGSIFLFLQSVSNVDSLDLVVNSIIMDTFSLRIDNPGNGSLIQIDTAFFSGNYELILIDAASGCEDTTSVLVGAKQSIIPSVDKTDPTCDNPVGQIQVTLSGSFDFVLLDENDDEIDRNTTGIFNDLQPATYGIAFENVGSQVCTVDTLKNIVINEPSSVSDNALDLTVVEPSCNTNDAQVIINFDLNGTFTYEVLDQDDAVVVAETNDLGTVTFDLDTLGTFELLVSNVDNPGICEPNRRSFSIQRSGGFTATASNKVDVVCFGDNSGSVVITLDGISVGYYSIDNSLWTEFTSGNVIEDLPAINNILVSDQPGTSECEISVPVNIVHLSQPITLDGNITLVTQASCTTAEEIGEIRIPEVNGGVAPYTFTVDGEEVTLDGDRIIGGLARNVDELTITDDTGCSETFEIGPIVSPNEVRAIVEEINPADNCLDNPEGLRVIIDQNTIDNVTGPYNFIINRVDETETAEFTLDFDINGSREFLIGPDENLEFLFEKGVRYRWTLRSVTNEQACSADNFITINAGAIIPTYEVEGLNAQCFGQSGAIEITNISADESLPLVIQLFNDRDDLVRTFTEPSVPLSGNFTIDPNSFGFVETGTYNIQLSQKPANCTDSIRSVYSAAIVDGPTAELFVELVPEPQLPPGVERSRGEMNPMPTTRPDFSNGSISIRLVSNTSATGYSAQIFLVEPLGGNNSALYTLPSEPMEFGDDNMLTFDNLLPGVYEIEYYDSFGCGSAGNKLVQNLAGDGFEITVDFDRSPFIPNIFTPDGDGTNDEFQILNLPDNGAELIVTNRTGAIVFRSDSYRPSNLWDGGEQPDGIYFYQLTIDNEVFSGWVEILRGGN